MCREGFDAAAAARLSNPLARATQTPACCCCRWWAFCRPATRASRGTVASIERELLRDGFVARYPTHDGVDGLPPGEGAFLSARFWLADNLVLQGRTAEARELFERLLALRNDVGLLSEEYDVQAKRLVGNFPQPSRTWA